MGLMDILNGMQNGPRGPSTPAPAGKSGGMSPLMMAMLGLLAYKAIKGGGLGNMLGGGNAQAPAAPAGNSPGGLGDLLGGILGGGAQAGNAPGGGLGDILGGVLGGNARAGGGLGDILGGVLGGSAAGGALSGGLRNLLQDMEENGQGDVAKSWVGRGDNKSIAPGDLANALGADTIDTLSQQTGMGRDQLLADLSKHLPQLVDQLTPDGRLPTEQEASRW